MITIGGVGSAGGASSYYAKDNYYTNSQGLGTSAWFGKGAEMLGLPSKGSIQIETASVETDEASGLQRKDADNNALDNEGRANGIESGDTPAGLATADDLDVSDNRAVAEEPNVEEPAQEADEDSLGIGVTAEELQSVLEGKVDSDTRLGYEDKDGNWQHMPGKDIVFAPSKSVSVMALVGGDKRLTEAFQESVHSTLGYVEQHLASVHDFRKGESTSYRTGNITAALFTHDTSRNQDPLLHVHAVVGNMTKDDRSNKWRALNFRAIYKNTYALNRILQADFGKRVEALGYSITKDQHGNVEIDAVPKDVSREFSSRRVEIEEHMDGREGTFGERRTATLATRDKKVELPRDKLTESWIERSMAKGFDPRDHVPNATSKTPTHDNALAVAESIEHHTELKTTLTHAELVAGALENRNSNGDLRDIEAHIDAAHANGDIVVHSDLKNDAVRTYTTKSQIDAERDIQHRLKTAPMTKPLRYSDQKLAKQIRAPQIMDGRTVTLNESQAAAVEHILTSKHPIIGIQGLAGVGKTTALGVMAKSLERPSVLGITFGTAPKIIAMAPTINAAAEVGAKVKADDMTVQKYLTQHQGIIDGEKPSKESLRTYKGAIILHDESSMMSNQMMRDFLKVNEVLGVRMSVMIGDTAQHGAVKAGAAFEMMQKNGMKTARMDQIVRQQTEPLLDIANKLAESDYHGALNALGSDLVERPDYIEAGATAHIDDVQAGKDSAIIVFDNATRKQSNEAVRSVLKERGLLPAHEIAHQTHAPTYLTPITAADSRSYKDGDRLEFRQDIYNREMVAGSVWTVTGRDNENNTIQIAQDGKTETWSLQKLERQPFDHWRPETIHLSPKDEVRFKTEDKTHSIKRDDKAKILDINDKTMTVQLKDGKNITLDRDERLAKQIVHAYATTSYAVQGLSIEHPKGVLNPYSGAATQQGLYVTGTRPIKGLKLYTSSKDTLLSRIEANSGKDKIATEAIDLKETSKDNSANDQSFAERLVKSIQNDVAERQRTMPSPSRGASH